MSGAAELTSVAYKKGNWMRYCLWGLAAVCIAILFITFFDMMSGNISAAVPSGYKFSVTDNYTDGSNMRTTYYVYNNKILVEDENFTAGSVDRVVKVYDGINTVPLSLDADDTIEICELGSCHQVPKVLSVVKQLISHQTGREYIGL